MNDLPACRQCGMGDNIVRDGLCIECAPSQPRPCPACCAAVRLADVFHEWNVGNVDQYDDRDWDREMSLADNEYGEAKKLGHDHDCQSQEK